MLQALLVQAVSELNIFLPLFCVNKLRSIATGTEPYTVQYSPQWGGGGAQCKKVTTELKGAETLSLSQPRLRHPEFDESS